jgi:DNA-binding protein H-NS
LRQVAKEEGYDLDDLMGKGRKTGGRKLPPKFEDPATGKTWSGKGPTPGWVKPYKVSGRLGDLEL